MQNHKAIGEISTGIILAHLLKRGKRILMPFGDNAPYDIVIDENGVFIRVQCKTAWPEKNGEYLCFNVCILNPFTGKRRNYKHQADLFLVYSPYTEKIYRVSVSEAGGTQFRLRLVPPKNNQRRTVHMAVEYEYQ